MLQAFRLQFDYLSRETTEKYLQFLRDQLLNGRPTYYGVSKAVPIATVDGPMYAVKLVPELEDPNNDVAAECLLNGHYFYLWQDICWAVATKQSGEPISSKLLALGDLKPFETLFGKDERQTTKKLIIHQIGANCV